MNSKNIRGLQAGAALMALVGLGACKSLDVPNYTNASVDLLEQNPTPSVINSTAAGVFSIIRTNTQSHLEQADILARNFYILDPSEVRNVNVPLVGPYDTNQGGFASAIWPYNNIRDLYELLTAVNAIATGSGSTQMTDAQKKGVSGFTKTWLAYLFHTIVRETDTFGAPIDVNHPRSDPLAPFATKAQVYAFVEQLLDDANTDLTGAGASFSFSFTPGFTANGTFNTPTTFRQLNRALKARVLADEGKWAQVLATLPGTFINPATPTGATLTLTQLNAGAYNIYSTVAGDITNPRFDATGRSRVVHPSVLADARAKAGGACPSPYLTAGVCDDRLTRKVTTRTGGQLTVLNHSSNWRFTVYNALDASIPIFRNEELLLLRAEANLGCSGTAPTPACGGDRAAALADINTIRVSSGGLALLAADPGTDPGAGAVANNSNQIRSGDFLLDELLYNKRYSLIYEFGHRWVDLRKYNMLRLLPHDQPNDLIFPRRPIVDQECAARPTGSVAGCGAVPGI